MTEPSASVTDGQEWLTVEAAQEMAVGTARVIRVGERSLALIRLREGPDGWRCIDNVCPHRGAGLAGGDIVPEAEIIICPWHAWPFSLRDGRSNDSSYWRVEVFEVQQIAGQVRIRLPRSGESSASSVMV